VGYLAPIQPTVTTQSISDTQIQIIVVPDTANADTVGMTATIFRDGVTLVEDISSPWTYEDSTVEAGKQYVYTAHLEQHGNPSYESVGKHECAYPAAVSNVYAVAINTTAITFMWNVNQGEVDFFFTSSQQNSAVQTEEVVAASAGSTSYEVTFGGLKG